ncbi:MAG: L-seryl-tRNA(Sec) selenium transferase [Deltaproteobacteria bacterium SM23_61]|nr:MAG: L-seryl-tRNA(Sec) selenium transferase [Deltaproteobacteria bacterium SM23_61]
MEPEVRQRYLRKLPAVDELLHRPPIQSLLKLHSRPLVVHSIRKVLEEKRRTILQGGEKEATAAGSLTPDQWTDAVEKAMATTLQPSLRPVINATGVVLHTNLGRAPLSAEALRNLVEIAGGYSNLEFNLETGERGSRYEHVEELLCRISGAESALVVNNNAGAVLLALNTLAEGKEVIVSRGQLVEIGGSFRIPDVMRKSGARLVEVGTTNRTHPGDYERAITAETALLLKVHASNFRILGFAAEVPLKDLVALAGARGLPVMEDLGSGCFVDLSAYGIEHEPTVQEAVQAGADVVTFSGDKLLGGPQAGMILGKKKFIDPIKKNPLNRALRIDKLTLAGLEATLKIYLDPSRVIKALPALGMMTWPAEELKKRAGRFRRKLGRELPAGYQVTLREDSSQVGGGALPLQALPTWVVAIRPLLLSAASLEERLRKSDPPVIARVKEEEVLLDLRTVAGEEEAALLEAVKKALWNSECGIRNAE